MEIASHGRQRRASLAAAVAVCAMALAPHRAAAQARAPAPTAPKPAFGWCQVADGGGRSIYYSRVFAAAPGAAWEAATNAFLAYLKQKYGLLSAPSDRGAPACQSRPDVTPYFVGRLQDSDKSAALLRNQKVVDTAWAPS